MSIKPYLNSDGKISASLVEGGGGGSQNIGQVLAVGNDANSEDINNLGTLNSTNVKSSFIDSSSPAHTLNIGTSSLSSTLTAVGDVVVQSSTNVLIQTPSLLFPSASMFSNTVGASAGKYMIITANDNVQYKLQLFAVA